MIRLIGYDVLTREVALEHSAGTVDLGVLYLHPGGERDRRGGGSSPRENSSFTSSTKKWWTLRPTSWAAAGRPWIFWRIPLRCAWMRRETCRFAVAAGLRSTWTASPACFSVRRRSNRFPPGISRTSKSLRLRRRGTMRRAMWALSTSLPKSIRSAGSAAR